MRIGLFLGRAKISKIRGKLRLQSSLLTSMRIKQFEDKGLSHYSYVIISEGEAALIDPGRDPAPYYEFVRQQEARITAVLETHSHADFVSSHLEIAETSGALIYASEFMKAGFPHQAVRDGEMIKLGKVSFKVLYTPGHSYDSVCFLLLDETGSEHALFSGDTLFIGDVGRPDLRESVQDNPAKREELALAMFRTIREKLRPLNDEILLYPAHGAGTLCGKSLSDANSSTIGAEKTGNYAFRITDENEFLNALLEEQPFMPRYFNHDVALNRQGAPAWKEALENIPRYAGDSLPDDLAFQDDRNTQPKDEPRRGQNGKPPNGGGPIIIDARPTIKFRENHLKGALNVPDGLKFETWLGSILSPDENFYLLAENAETMEILLAKIAKIGYEKGVSGAIIGLSGQYECYNAALPADFDRSPENYTIIDARNKSEYARGAYFPEAINIPLPELRERAGEVPLDKPLVVHCAAGYRSAIASSILQAQVSQNVYDMGNAIEKKKNAS